MIRLLELLIKCVAAFMDALVKAKAKREAQEARVRRGEDTEPRH